MTGKKPSADNFDKEFRLNSDKKAAVRGKIPSWIMILAGIAVIAAVVIVKQPFVRPTENGTRASLTVPGTGVNVSGQTASFNGVNDQQADPSELEARFGEQESAKEELNSDYSVVLAGSSQPFSVQWKELETDKSGKIIKSDTGTKDSAIYWVDETPFEVVVKPVESEESEDTPAVININGQEYKVSLEPLTKKEVSALPADKRTEVIKIGNDSYMLHLDKNGASDDEENVSDQEKSVSNSDTEVSGTITADEDPFAGETEPKADLTEVDAPVVAWLKDKPYSVSVKLYEEPAQNQETDDKSAPAQKAYFEADGEMYEVSLKEMDPEEAKEDTTKEPVVWIDRTPLKLSLNDENTPGNTVAVILDPVSEDELPALLKERFGETAVVNEPEEEDTQTGPEGSDLELTEEPEKENWFAGVFHSIFGGGSTPEPTPQVTVIAVTPTPAPKLPTATSIVVRMAPTSTPQSPVRLDPDGKKADTVTNAKSADPKGGDLNDPALWDTGQATPTPVSRTSSGGSNKNRVTRTSTPSGVDNTANLNQPDVIVVEPSDNGSPVVVTVAPTQEELPHTGMADGWNIPSMLIMLAGLLLVIIGVRRLRTNRR